MTNKTLPLLMLSASIAACDSASPDVPEAAPTTIEGPSGKADGPEFSFSQTAGGFTRIRVEGDAAISLFNSLSAASDFSNVSQQGLDYVFQNFSICVSNGSAAACELYADQVTEQDNPQIPFSFRGDVAEELFRALGEVHGIEHPFPSSPSTASAGSERWNCGHDFGAAYCSMRM